MEKSKPIPYGRQNITEEDIEAVVNVLRSDFLTQGPFVPMFEQKLCEYTGAKHSVAVNSCTSALHIACLALELGSGDILWTSPITFVASANCALYCGATVDFVDIETDTVLMSVEKLKEKLKLAKKNGKLPKIVMPVHFSGQSCDMKEIHLLSQQYGFKIIEDAAHAIGAKYHNNIVGDCRYSDITVFSFHPVKIITTGEGGVAMTNSSYLSEKMQLLRSHGIVKNHTKMIDKSKDSWYYEQVDLGFNYRMTEFQAALGISQLKKLDFFINERSKIAKQYDSEFNNLPIQTIKQNKYTKSAHHLFVIRVNDGEKTRDKLFKYLIENNVLVNLHYIPVYRQPYYNAFEYERLPNAERYYKTTLSIPIFPLIKQHEIGKILKLIVNNIG